MPRKKSASKKAREEAEKQMANAKPEKIAHSAKPFELRDYREELQKEQEEEEEQNSSSSESDEDDYGDLVTEDVENGLNEVLKAIRSGDERLFDKNVKFFKDPEEAVKVKKDKPIYLNDVLRENLIDGTNLKDDEEEDEAQEEIPFAVHQREENAKLLGEINNAAESDSDEDDFLVKKDKPTEVDEDPINVKIILPNPEKDKERFLDEFMNKHAWLPNKGKSKKIEEEDDSEFEDAADKFENAYNFRFEDPNAKEIISYSRNVASLRREKLSKRQRQRLSKKEDIVKDREEKDNLIKSTKQKKLNLVLDRLKEIKQAVGNDVSDDRILKVFGDSLMNEDFNDEDWDAKMNELFNDEYYEEKDNEDDNEKPTWDDLDEEMADERKEGEEKEDEDVEGDDEEVSQPAKESKRDKKNKEKSKLNCLKDVAEQLVESKKLDILTEVEEVRGRLKEKDDGLKYKYREVSPESFGLTTSEILNADDKQLGDFINLSKLAPFRPQEKVKSDKRKVTKSKYISQWRKRTFGHEDGFDAALKEGKLKLPSIVTDGQPAKKKQKRDKKRSGKK